MEVKKQKKMKVMTNGLRRVTRNPHLTLLRGKKRKEFVRKFLRDRRMIAVHEAGHVVIAKMLGISALAYIGVRADMDFDFRRERICYGWTLPIGETANDDDLRLIGVAGAVAELCWLREPVDEFVGQLMSDGDCTIAQCNPDYPDDECLDAADAVARVLRPCGSHWHDLLVEARKLILGSQRVFRANLARQGILRANNSKMSRRPLQPPRLRHFESVLA